MESDRTAISAVNWKIYLSNYLQSADNPLWLEAAALAEFGLMDGSLDPNGLSDIEAELTRRVSPGDLLRSLLLASLQERLAQGGTVLAVQLDYVPFDRVVRLWQQTTAREFRDAARLLCNRGATIGSTEITFDFFLKWVQSLPFLNEIRTTFDNQMAELLLAVWDVAEFEAELREIVAVDDPAGLARDYMIAEFFDAFVYEYERSIARKNLTTLLNELDPLPETLSVAQNVEEYYFNEEQGV